MSDYDPDAVRARMVERRAQRSERELSCELCSEPIEDESDIAEVYPMTAHRVCLLRAGVGGIGHLIAHDWWCSKMHDPDAGLTTYQSARLCDAFVRVMGVEAAAAAAARS